MTAMAVQEREKENILMERVKNEYGKKIGGSRRDQWCRAGLSISDMAGMTEAEKKAYVIKDNVWPKPDYKALRDEGRDIEAVYFIKTVRDSLAVRPAGYSPSAADLELYAEGVGKVRDLAMEVRLKGEIAGFRDRILKNDYFVPASEQAKHSMFIKPNPVVYRIGGSKFTGAVQATAPRLAREIAKKQFLYSDDEKLLSDACPSYFPITGRPEDVREASTCRFVKGLDDSSDCMLGNGTGHTLVKGLSVAAARAIPAGKWVLSMHYAYAGTFGTKDEAEAAALAIAKAAAAAKPGTAKKAGKKTFCYQALDQIRQTGWDIPIEGVTGEELVDSFGFWGGEFGNWMNNDERQKSIDLSWASFRNLAAVLGIGMKDVSMNGRLSIAFGARGKGNALAHYEPLPRPCINITKLRGAGSLGHEYGHFVDFAKGEDLGAGGSLMELADKGRTHRLKELCPEAYGVFRAMTYGPDGSHTAYFSESVKMARNYSRQGGYWESCVEMFARAFACWLQDRLAEIGITDDYLTGHADLAVGTDSDGNVIRAYPTGEERTRINEAMDALATVLFAGKEAEMAS